MVPSGRSEGEFAPCLLLASGVRRQSLGFFGSWLRPSNLGLHLHVAFSVCLLKGHAHCSGPALILYKLTFILALTSSAKTLFLSVLVDVNLEDTMQLSTQS